LARDIQRQRLFSAKGDILDIAEILIELRTERAQFDKAIKALEALQESRRDSGRSVARKRKTRSGRSSNYTPSVAPTLAEVIPFRRYGS
jgi:hypothetical protein